MVSQVSAPWADGNFLCHGEPWWAEFGDLPKAREVKPKKQEPVRETAPWSGADFMCNTHWWPGLEAAEEAQDALPGSFNLNWNTAVTVRV